MRFLNRVASTFAPVLLLFFSFSAVHAQNRNVTIVWEKGGAEGNIEVTNGSLAGIKALSGKARVQGDSFRFGDGGGNRLRVTVGDANVAPGPEPALVTVCTKGNPFSFFLRDVNANNPIFIPEYGVAVLPGGDDRSYTEVSTEILSRKNLTKVQKIEGEPETSFEAMAPLTRDMSVPIWLGTSRDMRLFEITEELEDMANMDEKQIRPLLSFASFALPETGGQPVMYKYAVGRGVGAKNNITRWLEDGALPIYHSETRDDDIVYHSVSFASLETSQLTASNLKGTDYLISDGHSAGRVFTDSQRKELDRKLAAAQPNSEEIVLYSRTEIENTGEVPRYAWMKIPRPTAGEFGFDHTTGFSEFSGDRIFCISMLNGSPMPNQEMALLLQPGEKAVFDFVLPHSPIPRNRAEELAKRQYMDKLAECKEFWNGKLDEAARISVPEKRIDEMIRAGLLHLDINTFGIEPDQPLAAKVGVYSPIGTESAPIIQFYASMGLNDIARRSLDYFMATQQESGQIMNYHGYTIETGAALWCVGEYFRYSHDVEWIEKNKQRLLKACDFLSAWRASGSKDPNSVGYGMISGKVADPEDDYHQFMLNSYGYLGMSRMAEVMRAIGDPAADRLEAEAAQWREAIRKAALDALAISPVVPLGDGTWCATLPPWPEAPGPRLLYQKRETFRSHGTFTIADAGLGPAYLAFGEVFAPDEPVAISIMKSIAEIMCQDNTGFSQPYYGRLNWQQAKLGMVKPFLNTYYTTMSGHADHHTYTFWEHYYRLSPHKTHEEGNFLMETRWMLYMEDGDTLDLFPLIPRAWMEDGKVVEIDGAQSYFGKFSASATSHAGDGYIEAEVECDDSRKPSTVRIRLPHPGNKKAVRVTGGEYDPQTETVTVSAFSGSARVRVEF